jgi:hypothetical protein
MLGDLFAERPSANHNTRLCFKHSLKFVAYIHHLYDLFSSFCNSAPIYRSYSENRPGKIP